MGGMFGLWMTVSFSLEQGSGLEARREAIGIPPELMVNSRKTTPVT